MSREISRRPTTEEEKREASWMRRAFSAAGGVILATGLIGTAVSA